MTPEQVIDLLTLAARFDRRTVGDEDVRAWGLIANEQDWHPAAAARAVVEHAKRDPSTYLCPGHIAAILDAARTDIRRRLFRGDITPPRELRDNPRAEIAWRREYMRAALDDALVQWARTGELPDPLPPKPELDAVPRPQLDAAIARIANRHVPR